MKRRGILQYFLGGQCNKSLIFEGSDQNLIKNGETLLRERTSLFDGKTNPIRCFSVDDLDSMNIIDNPITHDATHESYAGVWDDKSVLVKIFDENSSFDNLASKLDCREIAVATQMGAHRNVHRLLGCCLDTKYPVLVYEWPENGTLDDRIHRYKEQSKEPLEWKERLRIAWEIAHAISYLHTAFRRTIVHRNLKPLIVFLDQDDSARISDFTLSISIPEGKKHVEDNCLGTHGYIAPEYFRTGKVAANSDVFAFGVLLLVILTGKHAISLGRQLADWVRECNAAHFLRDIVDPAIPKNGLVADGVFERQLKELVELALRCSSEEEEHRPTMMDVAIELEMIMAFSDSL